MSDVVTVPYGAWPSPITAESLTASSVRLSSVALAGGRAWWLEGRPEEGGRNVLVMHDGQMTGQLSGPELREENILRLATGGRTTTSSIN